MAACEEIASHPAVDIRRAIGQNVRRYRLAAGLSQEELAARIGVQQGYISELEAGRRNPTALTLWHTALALSIKPAALFKVSPSRRKLSQRKR